MRCLIYIGLLSGLVACQPACPVSSVEGVVEETPEALKSGLEGMLFGHDYWLLSNDFGDTLEVEAQEAFSGGQIFFSTPGCEKRLVEGFEARRAFTFRLLRRDTNAPQQVPSVSTRPVLIRHAGAPYPLTVRVLNVFPALQWPVEAARLPADGAWAQLDRLRTPDTTYQNLWRSPGNGSASIIIHPQAGLVAYVPSFTRREDTLFVREIN